VGGFDERFRGLYEDAVFFAKVTLAHPAYVSDRTWLFYRQHGESCTAREDEGDYASNRLVFLEWLADHLERSAGPVPAAARRALARELWHCRHLGLDRRFKGLPSWLLTRLA